ncbi:MAG: DUF308 domain-containing protein [Clostridia bacterium]|nr:DUF308 domain-containing protein [Clostridia bacterium]
MAKLKINTSGENIVACVLYALLGLVLIIFQGGSLNILFTVIGALLVIAGLVDVFNNGNLVQGIVEAVVGVVLIVGGWLIADIILVVLGVLLIASGIMEIIQNYKNGFMAILSSIILVVIGILLVIAPWTMLNTFCIIAGAVFLVNAVLVLFDKGMDTKKVANKAKR